jgi:hypothetical protein
MHKITNTLRFHKNGYSSVNPEKTGYIGITDKINYLPLNAKLLAWGIFLFFFIENGTIGLIPKNLYFIYRNVRISDFLLYFLTIYALFNIKEYAELYRSKTLIIIKVLIVYLFFQFIISSFLYDYNVLEFFFRLKNMWTTLLIFPYLLLLKRKGLPYLIKLILPVAIVSNVLYILSSVTGVAFLPEIGIEKQNLPGGFQVYRVFGGTFYGELFFLGFIYNWITDKFRLYQLFLVILFIIPHILAFGRAAWISLSFSIIIMLVWNSLRKKDFKIVLKQTVMFALLGIVLIYTFSRFIPQASYLTDALGARLTQGQEDVENKEGTYGTRIASTEALLVLWSNSNIFFGIGMHPMWVVRPETVEENLYAWGFSDVRWASVLAAYGLVGFILAIVFQIYYAVISIKILKRPKQDLQTFFVVMLFSTMLFDTFINYSFNLISVGLMGLGSLICLYVAVLIYKFENLKKDNQIQ